MPDGYLTFGCVDTLGYRVFVLRDRSKYHRSRSHTLVAKAFIPNPENKPQVNHKDGDKLNNHVSNLEWVTHAENSSHAVRIGLFNIKGENHPMSKLTKEQVVAMRLLRKKEGLSHQKIASMFGVCRRQAGDVINGVNWGWLNESEP